MPVSSPESNVTSLMTHFVPANPQRCSVYSETEQKSKTSSPEKLNPKRVPENKVTSTCKNIVSAPVLINKPLTAHTDLLTVTNTVLSAVTFML